jgi:hypothetical protein
MAANIVLTGGVAGYGTTPTATQPHATAQSAVASTAITTLVTTPTATDIATAVNSLISRVEAIRALQDQTRTDLIALGFQKGSN